MTTISLPTIGELREEGVALLMARSEGGDRDTVLVDVDAVLGHVLCWSRAKVVTSLPDRMSEHCVSVARAAFARRSRGEPIAYIIGRKEFYGRDFVVGPGVLIPRPETEELVERVLQALRSHLGTTCVIDVGVGSGAILLSLAAEFHSAPGQRVEWLGIEIEPAAREFAIRNRSAFALDDVVEIRAGDLLSGLEPSDAELEVVVSNPPYIALHDNLPIDVRGFEPHSALYSGATGLDHTERLLRQCAEQFRLRKEANPRAKSAFFFEIGAGSGDAVKSLAFLSGFGFCEIHRDLAGRERIAEGWLEDVSVE